MKYIVCFISCFCFSSQIPAQNVERPSSLPSPALIFDGFSGIRERIPRIDRVVRWIYTISGKEYDIVIKHFNKNDDIFGKKVIAKMSEGLIKKKADRFQANIPELPVPNGISFTSSRINDTISVEAIRRFFMDSRQGFYYVDMICYAPVRDTVLEYKIVQSVLYDGMYDTLFRSPGKNLINFAGKLIEIKTPFTWMGVNNVYCPKMGQMNWSEHATLSAACRMRDIQLVANENFKKVDILKKDTVETVFEGKAQKALRVTYKAKEPRIFWGNGSKILLVYYVVSSRDDRFITTVLSHYEDQLVDGEVPPPLNAVMSIKPLKPTSSRF